MWAISIYIARGGGGRDLDPVDHVGADEVAHPDHQLVAHVVAALVLVDPQHLPQPRSAPRALFVCLFPCLLAC
jgi:hypothetical protein